MPNKNKKLTPFMAFALEYKNNQHRTMSIAQAISEAGVIWEGMSDDKKVQYKTLAKSDSSNYRREEKLTSQGVPLSFIENEKREKEIKERVMKKEIEDIVKNSRLRNDLPNEKFILVMGNYFVCNRDGEVYIPAEIGLSEFCLKDGVMNKFHSFVDPGDILFGYAYEAIGHSESTHKLPLYPNAFGEKELGKLYVTILNFICKEDSTDGLNLTPPAIYTYNTSVRIIKSMLGYLKQDCFSDDVPEIRVYPMQYLFYTLKLATTEISGIEQPVSTYLSDAILERDVYESTSNLSCNYHEEKDCTKYCALSCVVRWAYVFAENLCSDLAISMIPGKHCPIGNNLSVITKKRNSIKPIDNNDDDNCGREPQTTQFWNIKNEPETVNYGASGSGIMKTEDEFPRLGGKRTKKK